MSRTEVNLIYHAVAYFMRSITDWTWKDSQEGESTPTLMQNWFLYKYIFILIWGIDCKDGNLTDYILGDVWFKNLLKTRLNHTSNFGDIKS